MAVPPSAHSFPGRPCLPLGLPSAPLRACRVPGCPAQSGAGVRSSCRGPGGPGTHGGQARGALGALSTRGFLGRPAQRTTDRVGPLALSPTPLQHLARPSVHILCPTGFRALKSLMDSSQLQKPFLNRVGSQAPGGCGECAQPPGSRPCGGADGEQPVDLSSPFESRSAGTCVHQRVVNAKRPALALSSLAVTWP